MGDKSDAIKRIIGIVIFYTILFSLLTFSSGLNSDTGSSIELSDGGLYDIQTLREKGGSCEYPRPTGDILSASNKCIYTNANTADECNIGIVGCNITTNFLGNSFCGGYINVSYYNQDEGTTGNNESVLIGDKICNAVKLDESQSQCELLGCTWVNYEGLTDSEIQKFDKSPSNFLKAVGFVFGFNVDIGVSGFVQFILSMVFYITLLILIGSAYTLLPFV